MKRSLMKRRPPRRGPMPPEVAAAVIARDLNCCQAYAHGFDLDTACSGRPHLHHKRLRSQGGLDTLDNICTLCDLHHRRAHDVIRGEAEACDIIRRSTYKPRKAQP